MTRLVLATMLLVGCSKGPKIDPLDPNQQAVLPSWIQNALQGEEDACSSSPLWDDPNAKVATTFFAGYYEWDATDLVGNEFWVLYPDPELAATGFTACTVVWDVYGTQSDSVGAADYSITISGSVDLAQTDCIEDAAGNPVYADDENFTVTYDVVESSNGTVDVYFTSGTHLGRGEYDNASMSWLSDKDCVLL
ncbi:MAG: hypothetical protein H6737_30700 [Alphaproteobacteria bacterium]|nr:hypothetical protein [Alphaproteobacteria bacterium]